MKNKVAIVVVLAVLICLIPFPIRINRTLNGIYWENTGDQLFEYCTVTMQGWYYRYLVKRDVFKGDISFSMTDETYTYYAPRLSLSRDPMHKGKTGSAAVYDATLNQMISLGDITIFGNCKEILIQSGEWNICSPAETFEEAVKLANETVAEEDNIQ